MIALIIKKLKENAPDATTLRTKSGTVGGAVGIGVNVLIAALKAVAGLLFGSVALVADAMNNFSDAAGSVITIIGFRLAAKKPDNDHPYGHGRIEYLAGLLISFLVLMLGVTMAKESVLTIFSESKTTFSLLSVAVMLFSILAKLWLCVFNKKLGRLTGSATFDALAADSRNDCISTGAVLCSVLIFKFTGVDLDGIMGLGVSIFILISGIGLVRETLDPLLGRAPEPELVDAIAEKAMSYAGIIGIHDLVVHDYGPGRVFVSLHAEVDAKGDALESHDLIDNIERDFKIDMGLETVIHIDPVVTDDPLVNELKEATKAALTGVDSALSMHDFRVVPGPTHTNLIFDIVLPADFAGNEKELKKQIDTALAAHGKNLFTVITFDRNYVGKM